MISPLNFRLLSSKILPLTLKMASFETEPAGTLNNHFVYTLSREKFNDHLSLHSNTKSSIEKINFAME